jgi:hypothetical protein
VTRGIAPEAGGARRRLRGRRGAATKCALRAGHDLRPDRPLLDGIAWDLAQLEDP